MTTLTILPEIRVELFQEPRVTMEKIATKTTAGLRGCTLVELRQHFRARDSLAVQNSFTTRKETMLNAMFSE